MNDLVGFPDSARVWIYQGSAPVDPEKVNQVNQAIRDFAVRWTSHNRELRATGGLVHNRFVVLVVNEDIAGVSGCSIDASVQFVQQLGQYTAVDFMDRVHFAFLSDGEVKTVHKDRLAELYAAGEIDDSTLFFDNLVRDKEQFVAQWLKPLGESWMKRFV